MRGAALLAALLLAACGADGPPEPRPDAIRPAGIEVSGTASIGVSGTF
ncbi:hypothetical protein OCGS_1631 [Oceaniovalibus guishaninsula JLT2003]|uniref:Uncharacterized protein n=1 Tax=Oceaniovalibus guishaninsula JLT2003 TaxID=1231392 RepID=K2I5D7_9RHOB|nr:hypothetical protein [Oceaniovalibus guishaninsula]EKE44115.1 hypothetical protein OCGS_1631 [Oceaniovalibus guishaninsula JLT2003]